MSAPDPDAEDVKVSVAMVTYNHEPFIAQAIESVLMQQTEFGVELLIGEDCSTDGTREIVAEYAGRHPERIRPLWHEHNVGAQANSIAVLNACRGQYIAALEGDDYWTGPLKLQKQVDFLEAHPECSMCFHNVEVIYEDQSREPRNYCPSDQKEISGLEDILKWNFIPTCSVMCRRGVVCELPDWYHELAIGDWPLHILNAQYGDIGYIESVMGVHRVHRGGIWSSSSHVQRGKAALQMYYHLRSYLGARYQKSIKMGMAKAYLGLAAAYADEENIGEAKTNLWRSVAECPMNGLRQLEDVIALALRLYTPQIHTILKRIWRLPTASV